MSCRCSTAASVAPSGTQLDARQLRVPDPNSLFERDVGVDHGFVVSQNLDLVGTSKLNDCAAPNKAAASRVSLSGASSPVRGGGTTS